MKIATLSTHLRLATVATLALAGLAVTTTSSASTPSAAQTLARAVHDAVASTWVHEVVTVNNGTLMTVSVDDIGRSSGRQTSGNNVGATTTLIALDAAHAMYERANLIGASWYLSIPKVSAATYADRWLRLTPTTPGYAATALDTTLTSDFHGHLNIPGRLKFGPVSTLFGVRVRAITGTFPATSSMPRLNATLYVTVSGPVLPVALRERAVGSTLTITQAWSKWNVPVKLTAPTGAIPFPALSPAG